MTKTPTLHEVRAWRATLDRSGRRMFDDYATLYAHRAGPRDEINMAELKPGYGRWVIEAAQVWRPVAKRRDALEIAASLLAVALVLGGAGYGLSLMVW